jgi:hypothetical protein
MWDPVNSKLLFFVTKRLQLRFKKNTTAAAEPNGLLMIIDWNFWNLSIIHSPQQRHLFNT